ncbi:SwmB domain-containing protein [Cohnella panacarvi]|uniref:SwmB domain-containing protein n=1 Tax=Cohnella panacarvi TaxID=400776 RepID=UPI00047B55A8|nr:SwmB domain-containing protein [Cohnella panacarvi]
MHLRRYLLLGLILTLFSQFWVASDSFVTAATTDTTEPSVVSLSPAHGSSISANNSTITIKFSEPVQVVGGTISIQRITAPSGHFCTIPVTSTAVVGSGTDTLTITPASSFLGCGNFSQGNLYSVTIGEQVISDLSGNYFRGITNGSWLFNIIADAGNPELISTTPSNGNKAVKTSTKFTMQFNEDVIINSGAVAELKSASGGVLTFPIVREITDPRKVSFDVTGLQPATSYVVNIPNNAITDYYLNPYPGILNDYRWTFMTMGSDLAPPTVAGVKLEGSTVVLTYNEELDSGHVPFPGNYYVTVSDIPMQVDAVAVSSNTVRLTLHSGVAAGQIVKVSYTVDGNMANKLQDLSGNLATSFNGQAVTGLSVTTQTQPSSGSVSDKTVNINFNGSLQTVSPATSQFTVKINGVNQGVAAASINSSMLTLTLVKPVASGESVSVTYIPSLSPLRDFSGNVVNAFADFYVQNANDTRPPALTSATVSGALVRLIYNEGLLPTQVPSKNNFTVVSNAKMMSISSISIANNSVLLTLGQAIEPGAVVYLNYVPGSFGIADLSGNPAAAINGQSVTANSTSADVDMAVLTNNVITLFYNRMLDSTTIPLTSQFAIRAGSAYSGVSTVSVQGSQVNITLATSVLSGVPVTLSYSKTGTSLRDTSGFIFDSFSDLNVNNTNSGSSTGSGTTTGGGTATSSGLPEYLVLDSIGGVSLNVAKSTTMEYAALPSGRSGYRYAIDGAKLLAAYDVIRTGSSYGVSSPNLTLKLPADQNAQVSVPFSSMMDAATRSSNATLRIELGDLQYTLPLSAINYSKELNLANADISIAKLLLTIEKTYDASLTSAINLSSANLLISPTEFSAGQLIGSQVKPIESYERYVTRTFTLQSSVGNTDNVTVVRYDKDAGELVYVPTRFTQLSQGTNIDFLSKNNGVYAVVRNNTAYSDMEKHWAKSTVSKLASKFIVDGPTPKTFAPDKSITRAEFAEYLARGLGLNGDRASAARYPDVVQRDASAAYIGAVSKAGIVAGGTDGNFRPNALITRQEMASMLVRAMNHAGISVVASPTALDNFKDASKVGSWAKQGVSICVTAGFIQGVSATELKPLNNATRAEASVMLMKFLEYAELL